MIQFLYLKLINSQYGEELTAEVYTHVVESHYIRGYDTFLKELK